MSTRANVIIKDEHTTLYFYRHSDGYPDCTGADLKEFVQDYKSGALRLDAMQSAGWLIVRGHFEYKSQEPEGMPDRQPDRTGPRPDIKDRYSGWKVGAYEPTTEIHGDVEYVYTIDLVAQKLTCSRAKEFKAVSFKKKVSRE